MKIKKILSLILMVIMATMCFTGCSSSELNYLSIANEVSELKNFKIDGSVELEMSKEILEELFGESIYVENVKIDLAGEVSVDNNYISIIPEITIDDVVFSDCEILMTEKGLFVEREGLVSFVRYVAKLNTVMCEETLNNFEESLNKELGTYAYIQLTDFSDMDAEDVKMMSSFMESSNIFEDFSTEILKDFESGLVTRDGNAYVITITPENAYSLFKNILSYLEKNIESIYDSVVSIIPTFKGTAIEYMFVVESGYEDNVYEDNVYEDNVYEDNVYEDNVYEDNVIDTVVEDLITNREAYILELKEGLLEINRGIVESKEDIDEVMDYLNGTKITSSLEKKGNKYIEKDVAVIEVENKKVIDVKSEITYTTIDINAKDCSSITYISIDDFTTLVDKIQYKINPVDYMEIQYYNYSNSASAELARKEGTESTYFEYRIIDDRIYLPLRKICEYFGEDVYWDNEEHKAYIVRGEEKIDMTGTIIEERTFIKMRDFEKLGYTLDWKDTGTGMYIVEIYKDINK